MSMFRRPPRRRQEQSEGQHGEEVPADEAGRRPIEAPVATAEPPRQEAEPQVEEEEEPLQGSGKLRPWRRRQVFIGGVSATACVPRDPTLVPFCPAARGVPFGVRSPGVLKALRWLLQKRALGQDTFLLGEPGPSLRHLVAAYCRLLGKELEYVAITRDTNEADLKQRREVVDGRLVYVDQAPVRAARHGRVLLLEGIEKAERNVLPTLNNLLENREMALEDRSFLIAPARAAAISESESAASAHSLIPVSEDFEVIAVGQPSRGNPLDPPLRSRFAAREISTADLHEDPCRALEQLQPPPQPAGLAAAKDLAAKLQHLTGVLAHIADTWGAPPPLPDGAIGSMLRLAALCPKLPPQDIVNRVYPGQVAGVLQDWQRQIVGEQMGKAGLLEASGGRSSATGGPASWYDVSGVAPAPSTRAAGLVAKWCLLGLKQRDGRDASEVRAPCGALGPPPHLATNAMAQAPGAKSESQLRLAIEDFRAEEKKVQMLKGAQVREWLSSKYVPFQPSMDRKQLVACAMEALSAKRLECEAELERRGSALARDLGGVMLMRSQRKVLAAMLQDHAVGTDICLVGLRSAGKSTIARAFAAALGYQPRTVFCYQDMTSRDLLQRRTTDERGNTIWQNSLLLEAAIHGDLAVLDGVHRLAKGVLYSALGRLLHDRHGELADGSRLISPEHFQDLLQQGFSREELARRRITPVHPSFRVIATGEPPGERDRAWISGEVMTLFHFHEVPELPPDEELELSRRVSGGSEEALKDAFAGIARFGEKIRKASEADPSLAAMALSLRQLLRVGHHLAARRDDLRGAVDRALSARLRFMPLQAQEAVDKLLTSALSEVGAGESEGSLLRSPDEAVPGEKKTEKNLRLQRAAHLKGLEGFAVATRYDEDDNGEIEAARRRFEEAASTARDQLLKSAQQHAVESFTQGERSADAFIKVAKGELWIHDVSCPLRVPERLELVPDVYFVNMPKHVATLRDMLLDWTLDRHLLLIGNQGVGKNKLADRLLSLLRCEREYVQLHRDTTVQSLTLSQVLRDGAVVQEDSALVRAVRHGRCLVVDEADKAPLEVICVLKALADDGELALPDGRIIVRRGDLRISQLVGDANGGSRHKDALIETAPGFRLVVLANRPGYPFHGNDFYRVCGDVFSCHAIDNPGLESELALLRAVGEDVPHDWLAKLALLFRELREMADAGHITYPYSTRELVKVAQHLQRFPRDGPERTLGDVFAFDLGDRAKRQQLLEVLARHGFTTDPNGKELVVAKEHGDMTLQLDDKVDTETEGFSPENPDGTNPPEMPEDGPKHGDWDGLQHIGGNIAAGGSGGTGTAGLGGRWGPYRLDVGQNLVMVPESLKGGIDEETKKKLLKMAQEAHAKHMEKLRLAGPNLEKYQRLQDAVRARVAEMRVVLEAHEARERERVWLKQQTHGELDDTRLVDGITGSRNVYMRRGEPDANAFHGEQKLPKRMMFMLDISGSMYTFNRLDGRMRRLQELVLFLLESFEGMEQRYDVCMVGHSGSGAEAERLVEWGRPPSTATARLELLERMEAHAQYAAPGDKTIVAAELGVREVVSEPADEHFLFLVSDADLVRYGITGDMVSQQLTRDKRVHGYVILISNNTGEADMITAAVAPGHAHICAEQASLATTFKTIFTHAMRAADEAELG